jgi:hypothetical protein
MVVALFVVDIAMTGEGGGAEVGGGVAGGGGDRMREARWGRVRSVSCRGVVDEPGKSHIRASPWGGIYAVRSTVLNVIDIRCADT